MPPSPQVRDRAVANLHSKMVASSLVAVADLPALDLTGALLHAYGQRTLGHAKQLQMLELLLKVARGHPQGTAMLRERCASRHGACRTMRDRSTMHVFI